LVWLVGLVGAGLARPGFLGFWVIGFFWVFLGPFFGENLGFWVFGFFSSQNSIFFPKNLDFFPNFFKIKFKFYKKFDY